MKTLLPAFCLAMACIAPLRANDTSINDGNLGPMPLGWMSGEESIIQMKSEHLDIHFGIEKTKVLARFHFLSHKTSGPARQRLGFPIMSRSDWEGGVVGPIEDLVTRVDGAEVESVLVEGYFEEVARESGGISYEERETPTELPPKNKAIKKHAWYVVEVEFPVGKEVVVEREYTCPSGTSASSEAFFIYETRTGGAWKGEIERLTADLTFAPGVDTDLILFQPKDEWTWSEDRQKASLEWGPFEPRTDKNRTHFTVVTLNLERLAELRREFPDSYPDEATSIAKWKATFVEEETSSPQPNP